MTNYLKRLQAIDEKRGRHLDSIVSGYERQLSGIVSEAEVAVVADVARKLNIDPKDRIEATPGNQALLRSLDSRFAKALNDGGLDSLTTAFVNQFDGQLPFFTETLQALSDTMQTPLPALEWGAGDIRAFSSFKLSASMSLQSVVEAAGQAAARQALFTLGGLKFSDLVETISTEFRKSLPESEAIAATATSTYYRTVADRGFQIIEDDLPQMEIRYIYAGPVDDLLRPFCRRMTGATRDGESWTRKEIAAMSNGSSLGNVFINAGGWRCRHAFYVAPGPVDRKR